MMVNRLLVFIFIFCLLYSDASSQEVYSMSELKTIHPISGFFYDDGGRDGNVGSKHLITTFSDSTGLLELYFTEFNIPVDAALIIYEGVSIHDPVIGVFRSTDKPWSYKAAHITIEYIPSPSGMNARGWAGVVQHASPNNTFLATMPESDCDNAIQICSNSTINTSANQYSNTGAVNDDNGSCYSGTGNGGSVWYTFSTQTNGMLDFAIAPTGTTDYDFVLWDITNGCSSKVELSCNFSATQGTTGMNSTGTTNSEPAGGVLFCQKVNVLSSKKYAICINYYSGNNAGFQLTFKNEPGDVDIIDNTPPTITSAYADSCTYASLLHIKFSEWVQCATLIPANFIIAGHTIGIVNNFCSGSKTTMVDISISPPLTSGTYTLTGLNIQDMCGNLMNSNYSLVLGVPPVATLTSGGISCKTTNYLFGIPVGYSYTPASQTLTANNTAGGVSGYYWSDGHVGASNTVTPPITTTYTVTVTNGGCSASLSTTVTVEPSPTPNLGSDILMCAGLPMSLSTTGGASYQWQVQTGTSFLFNLPTFSNIPGATGNSYSTVPVQYGTSGATYYQVIVTSPNGCTGTDQIKITFGAGVFGISSNKPFLCLGENITLSVPNGITSYTWSTGTSTNAPLTVSPSVTTTYTVTSTTASCPGTSAITVPVRALPAAIATANPGTACSGVPVNLSGSPSTLNIGVSENFEGATQLFTLVNGAYNKWYHGTAAFCSGSKGLYVGTAAGNNNYSITSGLFTSNAATNHAYIDIPVSGFCTADLSFKWKCGGNSNASLSVWFVPTTFVPVAGTAIVASATNILAGGPYFGSSASCNLVSLNLLPYTGQTVRVVFSWSNTGGLLAPAAVPPAASIDDFSFTQSNTYSYAWTSIPSGFFSAIQNATANPTAATDYYLTVTRCDGCAATSQTIVGNCTPLAIELLEFTGICNSGEIQFEWLTASESNNDYYTLEKSKNGIDFVKATQIAGAGTSGISNRYSVSVPKTDEKYFRLKNTDFNGNYEYSKTIFVRCDKDFKKDALIFPNPAMNDATIHFKSDFNEAVRYQIKDVSGRVVFVSDFILTSEANEIRLNIAPYEDGLYFINIFSENDNIRFPEMKLIKSN